MDLNRTALGPIVCPVLIGRTSSLEALLRLMEQACGGRGQTVLITGEAGVGKSRLVTEALVSLRSSQWQAASPLVLQGRCFESDRALPYAPFLDLLRSFLASHSPDEIIASLGPTAAELAKLLPEFAAVLPHRVPTSIRDPEQEKRLLLQTMAHFFTRLSATQPLLLLIEDVHWSDESSLEFLLYLARRLASHRMLLLLTYRSEEEQPVFMPFLARLDRERLATELMLTPLTVNEAREMIHTILRLPRAMDTDLLEAIYRLTEGNPFFIEELLQSLIMAGELVYTDGRWERTSRQDEQGIPLPDRLPLPRSVQLAVQQRLDHVSAEARELLSLAAVAGQRFDFTLLQQVTRRNEAELLRLIKELITAQLVVEEAEDLFAFRHALTRQAVYTDLLARERKALHRTIAQTMEHLYADTLEAHLGDLASQYTAAGEWAKALEYAQRAGERAQALYAPRAAIEHYTHALNATRHLALIGSPTLYRARGQAYEALGEFEAARADYVGALEIARTMHDRQAEWQSLFDLGFLWTGRDYGRANHYLQSAIELARVMGDLSTLAHTLNRVGNWQVLAEQIREGQQCHQEALAIFQTLSDRNGLAETWDLLGITNYMAGDMVAGAKYFERAVVLWREFGYRQGLVSSLAALGTRGAHYLFRMSVCPTASLAECLRDGEEALRIAREMGWRSGEANALILLGLGLGPRGEFSHALEVAQSGLAIAVEIEHRVWMATAHTLLGALHLDLLTLPAAQEHFEQALSLAKEIGSLTIINGISGFLASTYIAQHELVRAQSLLDTRLRPDTPTRTFGQRLLWYAQAELALAHDHPNTSLEIIDRLIASFAHGEDHGDRVVLPLWHLRGKALVALGRGAEAETALQAAQTVARKQGTRPFLWRLFVTLGKLYRSQARREQAEEAFSEARAIIEGLAANVPDEAVRDNFLHSAMAQMPRLRTLSPRRAAKRAFEGLTEREREVAALVAAGKSNRALADELVVSERTIAKHVERIMTKLGVASRAQIAVWAVEKGLTKHTE